MSEGLGDDRERWRQVFEAEQARMWQTLFAHTRDADLAADAVAEAFAQGLRRGSEVRDPAAWVWRSAFRIADGLLAERRRSPVGRVADAAADVSALAAPDAPADEVVALLDSLARLSDDDRRLIVLSLVGGLGAGEIGVLVGARPGAVRVRLHRARGRLRSFLDAEETGAAVTKRATTDETRATTARETSPPPMGGTP